MAKDDVLAEPRRCLEHPASDGRERKLCAVRLHLYKSAGVSRTVSGKNRWMARDGYALWLSLCALLGRFVAGNLKV